MDQFLILAESEMSITVGSIIAIVGSFLGGTAIVVRQLMGINACLKEQRIANQDRKREVAEVREIMILVAEKSGYSDLAHYMKALWRIEPVCRDPAYATAE